MGKQFCSNSLQPFFSLGYCYANTTAPHSIALDISMADVVDSSLGFWDIAAASLPAFLRPLRLLDHELTDANASHPAGPLRVLWQMLPDGFPTAGGIQDVAAAMWALLLIIGGFWLSDYLTKKKICGTKTSRKLLHILIGLIYMLFCWPLFSSHPDARYLAVTAPIVTASRLLLLGLGVTRDDGMIRSMSRQGAAGELLSGPLCYAVAILLITVRYWRDSPVGPVSMVVMCGGDGIADIWGRRHAMRMLPWNQRKSWAGSRAMLVFGTVMSLFYTLFFHLLGYFPLPYPLLSTAFRIFLVNLGSTIVESLPISHVVDDNITVPLTAVMLSHALLVPPPL
eukprot:TRINITY_DN10483_c0_g1_i1.p1 TRINITY_DN10483_c0_g1~~TRINITY_DN10483_c0_g1_i1.p1  ORF type:complete len:339 (-),score=-3.41 TRINITY_DN10483_c0_g1_i1:1057-2073(-)